MMSSQQSPTTTTTTTADRAAAAASKSSLIVEPPRYTTTTTTTATSYHHRHRRRLQGRCCKGGNGGVLIRAPPPLQHVLLRRPLIMMISLLLGSSFLSSSPWWKLNRHGVMMAAAAAILDPMEEEIVVDNHRDNRDEEVAINGIEEDGDEDHQQHRVAWGTATTGASSASAAKIPMNEDDEDEGDIHVQPLPIMVFRGGESSSRTPKYQAMADDNDEEVAADNNHYDAAGGVPDTVEFDVDEPTISMSDDEIGSATDVFGDDTVRDENDSDSDDNENPAASSSSSNSNNNNKRVWGAAGASSGGVATADDSDDGTTTNQQPAQPRIINMIPDVTSGRIKTPTTTTTTSAGRYGAAAVGSGSAEGEEESSDHHGGQRMWGAEHVHHHEPHKSSVNGIIIEANAEEEDKKKHLASNSTTSSTGKNERQHGGGHRPFVSKSTKRSISSSSNPPEGFTLAARVYIGDDKMAHFDVDDDTTRRCGITLPYYDCGASGSTTAALPVKNAFFRHTLSAPTVWNDPEMHPVLAVALTPLVMELDSGQVLHCAAGDVILLEDSIRPGHRMVVSDQYHHNHLSVLFLTLPKPHYHTGKQHLSIKQAVTQSITPCPNEPGGTNNSDTPNSRRTGRSSVASLASSVIRRRRQPSFVWDGRRIRIFAMGTVALSLSTIAADFLAKVAPLWLAVGIGGTCFVAGSTYGLTKAGDYLFETFDLWREQRRLVTASTTSTETTSTPSMATTSTEEE